MHTQVFDFVSTTMFEETLKLYVLFFMDELRKFTISNFPKQMHLGYPLITLFFSCILQSIHTSPKCFCAGYTSSGCWLENNVKVWIDQMVKKKNKVINTFPKCVCLLRKITYGEFSEFVRDKQIKYKVGTLCSNFQFQ